MIKLFPSLLVVIGWDLLIRVGGRERRHSLVPSCQKLLEKLSDAQQSSLRDIVQVIHGHTRMASPACRGTPEA